MSVFNIPRAWQNFYGLAESRKQKTQPKTAAWSVCFPMYRIFWGEFVFHGSPLYPRIYQLISATFGWRRHSSLTLNFMRRKISQIRLRAQAFLTDPWHIFTTTSLKSLPILYIIERGSGLYVIELWSIIHFHQEYAVFLHIEKSVVSGFMRFTMVRA